MLAIVVCVLCITYHRIDCVNDATREDCPMLLIGNKIDCCEQDRTVMKDDAEKFATE